MQNGKYLLIVDMQNDFLLPDGTLYLGHDTNALQQFVINLANSNQYDVVSATQDLHQKDDCEFNLFPPHCIVNTKGVNLIDGLKPHIVYPKSTYCGRYLGSDIGRLAFDRSQNVLDVVGVCTHICVRECVAQIFMWAKTDGRFLPRINVLVPGIDDFDAALERVALDQMKTLYNVQLITEKTMEGRFDA